MVDEKKAEKVQHLTLADMAKIGNMAYALAHATLIVAKQPVYRCTIGGIKTEVRM